MKKRKNTESQQEDTQDTSEVQQEEKPMVNIQAPLADIQRLATAIRNAATTQCVFTAWDGLDFAYIDGALHRVSSGMSQYQRQYTPVLLRVEELVDMTDEEIWLRVMGG